MSSRERCNRCPKILTKGPRAGQVCNRRFLPPFEACVACRPPAPAWKRKPQTPEEMARARAAKARRRASAGVPESWSV